MRLRQFKICAIISSTAAILASLPATAQQQSWRQSSTSGEQTAYIDTATIRRDGDKVRFWREVRSAAPMTFETGERFDRLGAHMEVDCRARTLVNLEVYAKLGEEEIGRGPGDGAVEPIADGSTADTDLRAACFNQWSD